MRKFTSLVTIAFLLFASLAFTWKIESVEAASEILFFDDFDDGVADGWTVSMGTWDVVAAEYRALVPGIVETGISTVDSLSLADCVIEVKVRFTDDVGFRAGIIFRYTDNEHYYTFEVSNEYDRVQLFVFTPANPDYGWAPSPPPSYPISKDIEYTLRVEIHSNTFTGYLNGLEMVSLTDGNFTTGQVGLRARRADVFFDNFTVSRQTLITVPDDYPTIQEAINAASDGDTIFVKSGTYSHVEINKSVNLCGESKYTTLIDGSSYAEAAVNVLADNVKISNFTIQNGAPDFYIDGHSHITILDNIIKESSEGVLRFVNTFGNLLMGNFINGSVAGGGINFDWANDTLVCNNTVIQCWAAINGGYHSYNNTFQNNDFVDNDYLIYMNNGFDGCNFFHNNVNNSVLAHLTSSENCAWDNGYPSGGNYWSNYNGTDLDGDGIGDTPYIIDDDNQDNYPLMRPYVPFENQTIYIRADGSVDPSGAPIHRIGNLYSLTTDVFSDSEGIVVERDSIVIDGFGYTVQGTGSGIGFDWSGINNVTIKHTNIMNFNYGIRLESSSGNSISGNNITANNWSGVMLDDSSNNIISGNNITNNQVRGVELWGSSNNTVAGNNIADIKSLAIFIRMSSNNNISRNNITNNEYGIYLDESSDNSVSENIMNGNRFNFGVYGWGMLSHYIQSIDVSNLVNGKPVYYLINQKDLVINPSTHPQVGYLALINSTNVTVEDLTLTNNSQGLLLAYTNHSRITNNNITYNDDGIRLDWCSSNNTIAGNNIANNNYGIIIRPPNNIIHGNQITNNDCIGIYLWWHSNHTIVYGNNVTNNGWVTGMMGDWAGVVLYYSSGDTFYHNSFINNKRHVISEGSTNVWDDGYPSGGNYWSDFTDADSFKGQHQNETGSDGIWDQPYIIDVDNQDMYPLAKPFGGPNGDVDGDRDVDIFDIVRMAGVYGVKYPNSLYDRLCDMDLDGDIDIFDIVKAAVNYGKSW